MATMPRGTLPNEADLRLNLPILLFTLVATTLAGLLAGSAPAWYASRVDPGESLKQGGRTGTSVGKHRLRRLLVIGEFALALALLAGAGLAIHSFWNLTRVDLGVQTDHVLTFSLPVPDSRSKDPAQISAYYRDILAHIGAVPGVSHATVMTGDPLFGAGFGMLTPDYLPTLGIHLVKGRSISEQDTANSVKVVMVNESFAKKYFQGKDP